MPVFHRIPSTKCFADDAANPRLIVRPRYPGTSGTWRPNNATAMTAVFAAVRQGLSAIELGHVVRWLETQIGLQDPNDPLATGNRVGFFDRPGHAPLCAIKGNLQGLITYGIEVPFGNNYRVRLARSKLRLVSDHLTFTPLPLGDHILSREAIGPNSTILVESLRIGLSGKECGLVRLKGSFRFPDNKESSHTLYVGMGLVARFTEYVQGTSSQEHRVHESVLLHGGDEFKKAVAFCADIDPLAPYDETRSCFQLLPLAKGGSLELTLPLAPGHRLAAKPISEPKFVLTRTKKQGAGPQVYWTDVLSIVGTYSVSLEPSGGSIDLGGIGVIPGFAASEWMRAEASGSGLVIEFALGPADDPRLKSSFSDGNATDEESVLHLEAGGGPNRASLTSWARLGQATVLAAEAATARRLTPISQRKVKVKNTGHVVEVLPAIFDHQPLVRVADVVSPQTGFLPVLPARGVLATHRAAAAHFDRSFLGRERQKLTRIGEPEFRKKRRSAAPRNVPSTTPLGFELEQNSAGEITRVVFARYTDPVAGIAAEFSVGGGESEGVPQPLNSEFINAIVRNKLFLVANRMPKSISGLPFERFEFRNKIIVGGWTFRVSLDGSCFDFPGTLDDPQDGTPPFNTFMIVKNFVEKSIVDLVQDTSAWAAKESFLGPLRGDAAGKKPEEYLRAFIQEVKCLKDFGKPCSFGNSDKGDEADKERYGRFYDEILSNPDWQGVLVVDTSLDLAGLPLQIKGLIGGLDPRRIKATYIAVPMKRINGGDEPSRSRLAGLIDYDARKTADTKPPAKPGEDADGVDDGAYGYDITRLIVEFAGGEVKSFDAAVRLGIGKLFHAGVQLWVIENGNRVRTADFLGLAGKYRRRREGFQDIETYTFETTEAYRLVTDTRDGAPLIEWLDVDRAAYETLEVQNDDVRSTFRIDGSIKFGKSEVLGAIGDIIDLDRLSFTDLRITSLFSLKNIASSVKMAFRIGALGFDFGSATTRGAKKGFLSSFPLKFRKFWMFDSNLDLGKLGYFSFNGFNATTKFRFGFDFDLDLGTFGALTSFKGIKLGILFAFPDGGAIFDGKFPRVALGFRFPEGNGSLDLGIQGFLKVKAEKWGILDSSFPKPGGTATAKLIYAQTARLEILGQDFPDAQGLSLILFVDPSAISDGLTNGSVGWFAARRTKGDAGTIDGGAVRLDLLAIGQRVDPLVGVNPKTTEQFIEAIGEIFESEPFGSDPGDDPVEMSKQIAVAMKPTPPKIRFAPDRNWSVGFKAVFAEWVEIGFAMRDPDIYGLRVGLLTAPNSGSYLFAIDALYRKLSERLGVYSVEIIPPQSLRQLDFGAVTIDVPTIGIEIFTDGGFTIDLGYPWNLDFARSFGVQIFPFIGSGGLYYRQVTGPAAKLLPRGVKYRDAQSNLLGPNDRIYQYKPVIEAGLAFRVGLGKEIDKGIFRAGLSLTVFGTLEGGFGVLREGEDYTSEYSTKAASRFISVRGTVGILGEIYGYVDFGIVKAGISVRVWIAYGLHLRTDYRTRLYIQAGVSVRVSVVIGRIKIFGKRIEISVSFSFATTIEYSTYVGSDRNIEYYDWRGVRVLDARTVLPTSTAVLPVLTPDNAGNFDWTTTLDPIEWRARARKTKVAFDLYCIPDITMSPAPDLSHMRPEAVVMLSALTSENAICEVDELPVLVSAWAIKALYGVPPSGSLRDWEVSAAALDATAARFANGPSLDPFARPRSASARRRDLPLSQNISALFRDNLNLTLKEDDAVDSTGIPGIFVPLPPGSTVSRSGFNYDAEYDNISFDSKRVVDDAYRETVDETFQKLMALTEESDAFRQEPFAPLKTSIVDTVFEEHATLLIRAGLVQLAKIADEKLRAGGTTQTVSLGDILDEMSASVAVNQPPRSRDILSSATRVFLYGPRLPFPGGSTAPEIPPSITDRSAHYGLYRLAWLQVPLGDGSGRQIAVNLNQPFVRGTAVARIEDATLNEFAKLGLDPKDLGGTISQAPLARTVRRHFHAGRLHPAGADKGLLMLDPEICRIMEQRDARRPIVPQLIISKSEHPDIAAGGLEKPDLPASRIPIAYPAIAVPIRLKPGEVKDIFEIVGMSELSRVRLDRYEEGQHSEEIARIRLFRIGEGESELTPIDIVAADATATVVQCDLSSEPKPDTTARVAKRRRQVAATYVATADEPEAFVEIVRRTGIVNRGGTTLGWSGASADLRVPAEGKHSAFEALLVLELQPHAVAYANAAMLSGADLSENGLEATFDNADQLVGATVSEPVAEAGVVPIVVQRPRLRSPVRLLSEEWDQLTARFSMFAWSMKDQHGRILADAATNLAASPNRDAVEGTLRIEFPLPIFKLFNSLDGDTSPYDRVGETVRISGVWRDIFGNDWAAPVAEQQLTIHYVDRLIPLTDLPGLALGWWPGFAAGAAKVNFAFDVRLAEGLVPLTSVSGDLVGDDECRSIREALDRARAAWGRSRLQINDKKVVLTAKCPVTTGANGQSHAQWQDDVTLQEAHKAAIVKFLADGIACIDKMHTSTVKDVKRADLRALFVGAIEDVNNCSFEIAGNLNDNDFIELGLALETARPKTRRMQSPEATDDMIVSVVPISLPVRDATIMVNPPFGGTLAELERDVRTFASQTKLATGLPTTPSANDRAYWLVRDHVLPAANRFTNPAQPPLHFALPPISTHLHAFPDLEIFSYDTSSNSQQTLKKAFRNIDGDVTAARAFDAFEDIFSPALVALFGRTERGRLALQTMLTAKAEVAEGLGRRVQPIFTDAGQDVARANLAHRAVKDRILASLRFADAVDTIIVFPDQIDGSPDDAAPQAYGLLTLEDKVGISPTLTQPVEINPYVMAVGQGRSHDLVVTVDANPNFTEAEYYGTFNYTVSHVQRLNRIDNLTAGSPGRYRPTAWLTLVTPMEYEAGRIDTPIIRRRYPIPPELKYEHSILPTPVANIGPALRSWGSERQWTFEGLPTDFLRLTLRYNPKLIGVGTPPANDDEVERVQAFTVFVKSVVPVLHAIAGDTSAPFDDKLVEFLGARCSALAAVIGRRIYLATQPTDDVVDEYNIHEARPTIEIRRNVTGVVTHSEATLSVMDASGSVALDSLGPIRDGDITPPWKPAGWTDDKFQRRRLVISGADILSLRAVQTELSLTRNAMQGNRMIAPSFVYVVPAVGSGSVLAPSITLPEVEIAAVTNTLGAHIKQVIGALLRDPSADEIMDQLALDVILSYEPVLVRESDIEGEDITVATMAKVGLAGDPDTWLEPFSKQSNAWLVAHQPPPVGRFVFDIRLFERRPTSDDDAPQSNRLILRIKRATLARDMVVNNAHIRLRRDRR